MTGRRGKAWVGAAAVLILVGGGGAGAWAATRASGPAYRLATAEVRSVDQTLDSTGTIVPSSEADLSFPVAGQVATVGVAVGQHVTAGEVLAALDTTSLSASVTTAESVLTEDQARLAADPLGLAGPASRTAASQAATPSTLGPASPQSTSPPPPASKPTSPPSTQPPSSALTGALRLETTISQDETGLRSDMAQVAKNLDQEQGDQKQAATFCATTTTQPPTTTTAQPPTTTTAQPPTTTTAQPPTTTTAQPPTTTTSSRCISDEQTVMADQLRSAMAEQAVEQDFIAMTTAIENLLRAQGSGPPASSRAPSSAHSGSTTPPASPTSARSSAASTASPSTTKSTQPSVTKPTQPAVMASQVDSDQAATDDATAQLADAQRALGEATMLSPIGGTVAAVRISPGQPVAAASSPQSSTSSGSGSSTSATAEVVVMGSGSFEAQTSVSDAQIGQVSPGQVASVVPDGLTSPISGTVVQVGLVGTQSGGATTYPVTIGLRGGPRLVADSRAALAIVVRRAPRATAVPTSAVHTLGSRSFVQELRHAQLTSIPIVPGAVGAAFTQVITGLQPDDQVVLANLSTPVPTGGTTSLRGLVGGFGGGAFRGGGAGGAGAAGGGVGAGATRAGGRAVAFPGGG